MRKLNKERRQVAALQSAAREILRGIRGLLPCGSTIKYLTAPKRFVFIETRSLPRSLGAYPCAFTFYLAPPIRSIRVYSWLRFADGCG